MDAATEKELLRRWSQEGDVDARNQLVAAHQTFVARVAKRYGRLSGGATDLIQEGNLGLLHALDRFDPNRDVRLATYAGWWVRAYVLRYVERNRGVVHGTTTANRSRVFYQLERTRQRLAADGESVSREAIAHALGVSEQDVAAMEALRGTISLDSPVDAQGEDQASRIDRLVDLRPRPDERVEADEMSARLATALSSFQRGLRGHHLEMFRDRVASPRPATLTELGERWGLTRTVVRRIETRVARPLRSHLLREMGDSITLTLGPA